MARARINARRSSCGIWKDWNDDKGLMVQMRSQIRIGTEGEHLFEDELSHIGPRQELIVELWAIKRKP